MPTDLLHVLMLNGVPYLGDRGITAVLKAYSDRCQSLEAFFSLSEKELKGYRLHPRAIKHLIAKKHEITDKAKRLQEKVEEAGIKIVTLGDVRYPPYLSEYYDTPPPILYLYGNENLLERRKIAFVNSRNVTETGLKIATETAGLVAAKGIPLVTSGTKYAYNLVAFAAKREKGSLIIVLDRGIFSAFEGTTTKEPLPLLKRFDEDPDPERQLMVSPFRLDQGGSKGSGPKRDRLIFGLSDLVIAVEVREGGVMQEECLHAAQKEREVYVCRYAKYSEASEGNRLLIAQGLKPLTLDDGYTHLRTVLRQFIGEKEDLWEEGDAFERRQRLGQFFTPPEVVEFIWRMLEVYRNGFTSDTEVIDPACGEGIFLMHVLRNQQLDGDHLFGLDIDPGMKAQWEALGIQRQVHVHIADGLIDHPRIGAMRGTFDIVVGNPPYGGTGLRKLQKLIEARNQRKERAKRADQIDLFPAGGFENERSKPDRSMSPIELGEKQDLVRLGHFLIRNYESWRRNSMDNRFHSEEENPDEGSLFAGLDLSRPSAGGYDKLREIAEAITEERIDRLEDQITKSVIQRLSTFPIEILFTERFLQLAKPGGYIAIILPEGIFANAQTRYFRQWLIEQGRILAVVSLPRQVFAHMGTTAKTSILFMRKRLQNEEVGDLKANRTLLASTEQAGENKEQLKRQFSIILQGVKSCE